MLKWQISVAISFVYLLLRSASGWSRFGLRFDCLIHFVVLWLPKAVNLGLDQLYNPKVCIRMGNVQAALLCI